MSGVYVAVKYFEISEYYIQNYILDKVPNPIDRGELHTTVIYSNVGDVNLVKLPDVYGLTSTIVGYDVWESEWNNGNVLVAKLESKDLNKLHTELRTKYNLNHGFPNYNPHITVATNVPKDFKLSELPIGAVLKIDLMYAEEIHE